MVPVTMIIDAPYLAIWKGLPTARSSRGERLFCCGSHGQRLSTFAATP
jgi:hypothetical protein